MKAVLPRGNLYGRYGNWRVTLAAGRLSFRLVRSLQSAAGLISSRSNSARFDFIFSVGKRYKVLEARSLRNPTPADVIDGSGSEKCIDSGFMQNFKHTK